MANNMSMKYINRCSSRNENNNSSNNNNNSNNGNNGNNAGNSSNGNINNQAGCAELMKAIMEADFFATDLKLYLDTHPDDERAIGMFREAVKQYNACKAAFEESFYPITSNGAGKDGEWDWLCGKFPPQS